MSKKIYAIIQARTGSTRLKEKIFRKVGQHPILYWVIRQVRASKLIDEIILATTKDPADKKIIDFAKKNNLKYFRGSTEPLQRYYECATKFSCDPVIRITSDSPFIDPRIIDRVIRKFLKNSYDFVCNTYDFNGIEWKINPCGFPQGMMVEIPTFDALKKACNEACKPSEREHVFPYIISNPDLFKISNVKNKINFSKIRCTVDRNKDLKFVREIHSRLRNKGAIVHIKDIIKIVEKESELLKINEQIGFDDGFKRSLIEDNKLL